MLKISREEVRGWATLLLEGALAGLWVHELRQHWWGTRMSSDRIIIDLKHVTIIDDAGRELLEEMHAAGTQLRGSGVMTNYILQQIEEKNSREKRSQHERSVWIGNY